MNRAMMFVLLVMLSTTTTITAREWYVPKRTDLVKKGGGEAGVKFQLTANNDGLLDRRRIELIPNIRYAPLKRLELYMEMAAGHAFQEDVVGFQIAEFDGFGVGDLFTQVTYDAWSGSDWRTLSHLDLSFPTGKNPYDNRTALGGGHYTVALGQSAMKVLDPLVLFAFLGIQQPLSQDFASVGRVAPGMSVRFRIGTSINLNPRARMSLSISGESTGHTSINGTKSLGSSSTTARYGWGLDWSMWRKYRLTLDAIFGATKNTTDAVLILGMASSFGG